MSKIWLIALHQFGQEVGKRSFLLVLFSLPLFLVFAIGLGFLIASLEEETTVLGFVDQADLLVKTSLESNDDDIQIIPFPSPEDAEAALESEDITAYYLLPSDYHATHQVELVYYTSPPHQARLYFRDLVRYNLMADQSPEVIDRILSGADITVQALENKRQFPISGPSTEQFVPLIAAAIFSFLVLTTSGYMLQVVVAEKENRTMEIVMSSVSPAQMMAGKTLGAFGIALMQLVVWVTFLVGAVWVGGSILQVSWLQDLTPNWSDTLKIIIVAFPSYFFLVALMTLVGSTLVESQEAQQAGSLIFLPLFLPIYLIVPITENLNGPLSLLLSFFPVTAVTTLSLRTMFMQIPLWQIALSALIALVSGVGIMWLAGKAFRLSMLRYGQRLKWRELFSRRLS